MVERRWAIPGWDWDAIPSIEERDIAPCVVPLFNGLATWVFSISVDCFQGHQATSLRSQFLIACVTIFSFAFVVVQP
jgi:hypothetical protein